ncbi:FYVE, RhoGEF and PH domain-containing protein 6-like [Trichomycterus rosablanca]|uniref:FYVE, RhoGEF and PH domain-containing protein 6-like n=1 Tax=Trichomycterus rosablanca TaxID=2290929 RepID=UPI002F355A8D
MDRRTGFTQGVEKPPVAPKPKPILPSSVPKYEPDLEFSQPQIKTVRPAIKPHLFEIHTAAFQPKFQQRFEKPGHFRLLNSSNGFEHRTGKDQALATTPNDFVHDSSSDKPTLKQSYGTVKHNQILTANGSVNFEKLTAQRTQINPGSVHVSSPTDTGLSLKTSESQHVLVNNTHHGHPVAEQNRYLPSVLVPVRKPPPLPVQKSSSSVEQQQKPDIRLKESEVPVKSRRKVFTMNERTLTTYQKQGSATISPRKRVETEKKPFSGWRVFPSEQNQRQELPSTSISENAHRKRPNLKPKVRSFSPGDKLQNDVQKKPSFKIIRDLDLSVKFSRIFSKAEFPVAKDEQSVDEDWQANSSLNELYAKIPQYRTHQVRLQNEVTVFEKLSHPVFTREQSVDGEDVSDGAVENEHLYEDIPDYVNVSMLHSPRTQSQERLLSNNTEDEYGKPNLHDGSTNTNSRQLDETNSPVYEELYSSDECDISSEEEEDDPPNFDKVANQNDSKKSKLFYIAQEIMSSEKVFVDSLKLLHINFRDTVTKASNQAGKPVIEERILNQILFSMPQFFELNSNLLKELTERMANWSEHQTIADVFLTKGPYLKMYSSYICEFDKNVALLDEQYRKNPAFAKVVQQFESSPCCASLAVKHYMLKPVQRLPQYQLLLSEYLKNLDEGSPEFNNAEAALNIVKEVASHANETMKQGDNFQKLMQVQCSLIGHHEIVKPGRVFLKEGTLLKLSKRVMQPQMFFLFNDALLCAMPLQSGQYKLNNEISLAGMKVSKPSQEGYKNELNIESVERSFILFASSPSVRDEWLESISNAIEEYTMKQTTFSPSNKSPEEEDGLDSSTQLGTKAPIWIPDVRTTMCMICTCEFTLTWRRHHCRACGKVVCQACSSNRYPLEYLKNQPARVCDKCFEILLQNNSGTQAPVSAVLSPNTKSFYPRRQKKIPAALKEVSANTDESSMSGYLERMNASKKQWKRLWFVIKNKVLYTYGASEDVAALESLPLLGFSLAEDDTGLAQQFRLFHKNKLFYIFKTEDPYVYNRWIKAVSEAMIL